ncbi:histidine kinase N-terminal domain-containing protein [Bacillus sp. B15-48]|uniref:histidine kinase N-terminal domain-containing protein n=1 Tax=Bacillus sp. B15-48 TaxID=1548601 RepID=UPI00193FEA59|nr:histidine kinase N-terminal domain-containing protein [Bacillus sp. B15-48]MBM4764095.1 GHKL domain-containing protein [Bacillus sp. B15-48]
MQVVTLKKLSDFLETEKDAIITEWHSKIILPKKGYNNEYYTDCPKHFFELMIQLISKSKEDIEPAIKKLAIEIGEERVKSESNIGDFVYNVNIGRSIIYANFAKLKLEWTQLQESINRINYCFDRFLYYAVSYYSEHKDKIIEEKTEFINSTHKDRLTLLGQMTSSFIHEFRNPLTSVQGFIQLLKADYPDMEYLDIIKNELEQLNFRISQFLLLSKKELIGKEKTQFSVNQMLNEVLTFLYPSILDAKVKVVQETPEEMQMVGYADEIRQVLINIIFNAVDVLSQYREDPRIEINARRVNQSHLKLEIANNGPAIPENMLNSIFEPFVTTKKLGTGLGLFVSREIIEKHKGFLACSSIQDRTEFMILLPLAK